MNEKIPCFVDKIQQELKDYQIQKIIKQDKRYLSTQEKYAQDCLIQLDDQNDVTRNQDQDVHVGRWSSYKVPSKIQERLSFNRKGKKGSLANMPTYRYMESVRGTLPSVSRSQKTIPKLKVILHQLDCPLQLKEDKQSGRQRNYSQNAKMKSYSGSQALVISNKQQIKPSLKSQRKSVTTITTSEFYQNIQNKRPPTGNNGFKGQPPSNSYQKIKRPFGNPQNGQVYQKQILSQLIKNNIKQNQLPQSATPLSSMLNYFTMSTNDTKKKITTKLGLDKLLS